jgi:anti-sigma factor RsiW
MTCREFIELLDTYLEGEVELDRRQACEMHLSVCESCTAYLDSYRKTIELGKAAFADPDAPVPDDVPEDLVKALLQLRRE